MTQEQAIKASKNYFDWYKDAKQLFMTSDGQGHDNKQYATDHSRRLDDQTIWLVSKEQLEAVEEKEPIKAAANKATAKK